MEVAWTEHSGSGNGFDLLAEIPDAARSVRADRQEKPVLLRPLPLIEKLLQSDGVRAPSVPERAAPLHISGSVAQG